MIRRVAHWWKHLGYCWNSKQGPFTQFAIRPWVGAPVFWLTIDRSDTAVKKGCCDGH